MLSYRRGTQLTLFISLVFLVDRVVREAFRFNDCQCNPHAGVYYEVLLVGGRVLELHGYCTRSRLVMMFILETFNHLKGWRLMMAVKFLVLVADKQQYFKCHVVTLLFISFV